MLAAVRNLHLPRPESGYSSLRPCKTQYGSCLSSGHIYTTERDLGSALGAFAQGETGTELSGHRVLRLAHPWASGLGLSVTIWSCASGSPPGSNFPVAVVPGAPSEAQSSGEVSPCPGIVFISVSVATARP